MTNKLIMALCVGLCAGGGVSPALAEDMTINRLLASQCAQCHGTNGHAVGEMERLSDESYADLFEDLMDMRPEDRPEDIMDHQTLGYTDDQIRRIAAYYGLRSGRDDGRPGGGGESDGHGDGGSDERQGQRLKKEREKREQKRERRKQEKQKNRERGDD